MKTIADYPAYRIYQPHEGRKFSHGEKIAIPYESRTHGTLFTFYTLGTVAGYAMQYGEDPFPAVERAKEQGHKLYWANQNAVSIHNGPHTKEHVPGFNIGDEIILQGHTFRIERAPNQNINLVEVERVILRRAGMEDAFFSDYESAHAAASVSAVPFEIIQR